MLPFPFEKVPLLLPAQLHATNDTTEARPREGKLFPDAQEDFPTSLRCQARAAPALALRGSELSSYTLPAVISFSSQRDSWDSDRSQITVECQQN